MESVQIFEVKDYTSLQTALDGLCQFLTKWKVAEEKVFDCKLVACELVGNVLKYTDGKAGLQVSIADGIVSLKALSECFFELPENIVCSGLYAESGRGLFLVNSLCEGQISAETDGIVAKIKL
jgi:anti-sigma regulatory factor (Ser/Thr protein kinase)